MKIGIISTRLSGTDGVSLETEKWVRVLENLGHELFYCAGELGGYASGGTLIPALHFEHPDIADTTRRAFVRQAGSGTADIQQDIEKIALHLEQPLRAFLTANGIELLIVQNALSIPMNIPLALCLSRLIEELELQTIGHHHDFYWERERFQTSPLLNLLDRIFPPHFRTVQHVAINSLAQGRLLARRGIHSMVVPNVFNFDTPAPGVDAYNQDFRAAVGISPGSHYFLQPTRVIRRKGIELALEFVNRLDLPDTRLVITHKASDEGLDYWHWLQHEASMMQVQLRLVDEMIGTERSEDEGRKIYSLWDAYPSADLVTYPSLQEGFGNALLEAIYFKRPVVINRYPVYNADIGPLGFDFVELDGFVDERSIEETKALLKDPERVRKMTAHNFALARQHFSMQTLRSKIEIMLMRVGQIPPGASDGR